MPGGSRSHDSQPMSSLPTVSPGEDVFLEYLLWNLEKAQLLPRLQAQSPYTESTRSNQLSKTWYSVSSRAGLLSSSPSPRTRSKDSHCSLWTRKSQGIVISSLAAISRLLTSQK